MNWASFKHVFPTSLQIMIIFVLHLVKAERTSCISMISIFRKCSSRTFAQKKTAGSFRWIGANKENQKLTMHLILCIHDLDSGSYSLKWTNQLKKGPKFSEMQFWNQTDKVESKYSMGILRTLPWLLWGTWFTGCIACTGKILSDKKGTWVCNDGKYWCEWCWLCLLGIWCCLLLEGESTGYMLNAFAWWIWLPW